MKFKVLSVFALLSGAAYAQTWNASPQVIPIANDGAAGTVINTLAKLSTTGKAVRATTSDLSGIVGIVAQNAGTSGYAGVVSIGNAICAFDGATVAGDYVQASPTVGGSCHDAGSTFPASGTVVGRVLTANSVPGYYSVFVFPAEIHGGAISGGGSYLLPPASSGILGGVTIGALSGLAVNGSGAASVVYGRTAFTALQGNDSLVTGALQDPGANGLLKRTSLGTTAIAGGADMPAGYPYASIQGAPLLYNQLTQTGGNSQVPRSKLNFIGGSNVSVTGSDNGVDTTNITIAATGTGSLSSVNTGVLPSWLSGAFANPTTAPILNLSMTTGQISHQVLGTCGNLTTFVPCALTASDLPSGYPYTSLSGSPALANQAVLATGVPVTPRQRLNFASGNTSSMTIAAADNGSDTTTLTFTATGGGGAGSLTSLATPIVPSWLTAAVANPTTIPAITLAPATGQTAHQFIGTGLGASFIPTAITVADLPNSVTGQPAYSQAFTSQTSVTLAHNYATQNVVTQCYDSNNTLIAPGSVSIADSNDVTVTFLAAQTGRCVVTGMVGPTGAQGIAGASGGTPAFSSLTGGGTNTGAAMLVGNGSTLASTGTGTITANNYSGTLPAASLPSPAVSAKGGVQSANCVGGVGSINTDGTVTCLAGSGGGGIHTIGVNYTAGGAVLTAGPVAYVTVPYSCTISAFNASDDTGTFNVDVWKIASGTANPTAINSIVASAYPGIVTGTTVHSTTLTGWTTTVTANDVFAFKLRTASATVTQANVGLQCQ